jgi:hypothetical protein
MTQQRTDIQRAICSKHGADFLPCIDRLKIGISRKFASSDYPINGLRHLPHDDTTGWYIWSGRNWSEEADFFVPLHAFHLRDRCPGAIKFLALAPGWRFLFDPNHEDVWFDESLLRA